MAFLSIAKSQKALGTYKNLLSFLSLMKESLNRYKYSSLFSMELNRRVLVRIFQ